MKWVSNAYRGHDAIIATCERAIFDGEANHVPRPWQHIQESCTKKLCVWRSVPWQLSWRFREGSRFVCRWWNPQNTNQTSDRPDSKPRRNRSRKVPCRFQLVGREQVCHCPSGQNPSVETTCASDTEIVAREEHDHDADYQESAADPERCASR